MIPRPSSLDTGQQPPISGVHDSDLHAVLCYVEGSWAWFTTAPLAEQWGDDWNDAPYQHNAGVPYEREGSRLIRVAWHGPFRTPEERGWDLDGRVAGGWSVEQINAGALPWLQTWTYEHAWVEPTAIYAGTTLYDFARLVQLAGGAVYVPIRPLQASTDALRGPQPAPPPYADRHALEPTILEPTALPDLSDLYWSARAAVDQHAPSERDWRRDTLQEAVSVSMREGARAAAEGRFPDVWIGHGRGEVRASMWLDRRAAMTDSCRTGIVFTDQTCGLSVFRPSSCHTRGCPRCEARRAGQLLDRFERAAMGCNPATCRYPPHLRKGGPGHLKPMRYPKLLTLTVPNAARGWDGEELAVRLALRQITRYFGRLRERAIWRGGQCKTPGWKAKHADWLKEHGRRGCRQETPGSRVKCAMPEHLRKRPARLSPAELAARKRWQRDHGKCGRFLHQAVSGGVRGIETTYNVTSDTWNVHMHVLVDGPFLIASELLDTWRAVTEGAALVLDVKAVRCKRCERVPLDCRCVDGDGNRDAYGMRGALREVLKYIGKPSDDPDRPADPDRLTGAAIVDRADPLRLAELAIAWHGARLVAGFGTWSSLPGDEHQVEDTVPVANPDDPFGGWRLPRVCPFCLREARWAQGPPNIRSRLEPVRFGAPPRKGAAPPLLWMEPAVV